MEVKVSVCATMLLLRIACRNIAVNLNRKRYHGYNVSPCYPATRSGGFSKAVLNRTRNCAIGLKTALGLQSGRAVWGASPMCICWFREQPTWASNGAKANCNSKAWNLRWAHSFSPETMSEKSNDG